MKITYLRHSGFLVELEQVWLLFDYYRGEIPEFPKGKKGYVFVSHRHIAVSYTHLTLPTNSLV